MQACSAYAAESAGCRGRLEKERMQVSSQTLSCVLTDPCWRTGNTPSPAASDWAFTAWLHAREDFRCVQ